MELVGIVLIVALIFMLVVGLAVLLAEHRLGKIQKLLHSILEELQRRP